MAFLLRVVRPVRWWPPLVMTLGLAGGLGTSVGAATASPVTAGRPAAAAASDRSAPLVVQTGKGAVRGLHAGNARQFFGIPYAPPPVGPLPLHPPHPPPP